MFPDTVIIPAVLIPLEMPVLTQRGRQQIYKIPYLDSLFSFVSGVWITARSVKWPAGNEMQTLIHIGEWFFRAPLHF